MRAGSLNNSESRSKVAASSKLNFVPVAFRSTLVINYQRVPLHHFNPALVGFFVVLAWQNVQRAAQ
jgi:hypothetical protein